MIKVHGIPAFTDNYIWCIYDDETRQAIIVDPGSYTDVIKFINEHDLVLNTILITHHHPDHIGGLLKLKSEHPCLSIASKNSKVSHIDQHVSDQEQFELLGLSFKSYDVPGHTLDHNAYYCEELKAVFCGDTVFSAGCGRLFEGKPKQMLESLNKLRSLPLDTKIYCAHEYTQANLEFALSLMPNNLELNRYHEQVATKRSKGLPTIPTDIRTELSINPFFRSADPELIAGVQALYPETSEDELAVFTATRLAKDNF